VAAACLLLGACGQLLGLNNYEEVDGGAGTGGSSSSGRGGRGGQSNGGMSGNAGGPVSSGGTAGSHGGNPGAGGTGGSGTGGSNEVGGAGGEPSSGGNAEAGAPPRGGTGGTTMGKGGSGNATGGKGGTGGSVAQGGGGEGGCSETIEIGTVGTPTTDPEPDYHYYSYEYNIDPQIDTAASDYFWLDFYTTGEYTGDETGRFQLGTGDDANYASCSRCIWVGVDVGDSGIAKTYFYAKSGTLDIASDSEQMNGLPDMHLTDVLFSEVTIDSDTHVSTEVWGGRCLHLVSASLVITSNVPSTWKCPAYAYGGGATDGCDCGCGAVDPDCASNLVGACDYCDDQNSCAIDCSDINLSDNSTCSASNQGWTCDPLTYGDGSICNCGCGIVDYDCAGPDASYCDLCDDPNSCAAGLSGDCSVINPTDNSKCQ
jgi:hypothetical protein